MSLPKEYIVETETKEETNEIRRYYNASDYLHNWDYILYSSGYPSGWSTVPSSYLHLPQYTFQQWKSLTSLPEKWAIRITSENRELLQSVATPVVRSCGWVNNQWLYYKGGGFDQFGSWGWNVEGLPKIEGIHYNEITVEQFRQITDTMKGEKKEQLVGYILKDEFKHVHYALAAMIGESEEDTYTFSKDGENIDIPEDARGLKKLKDAGVLDLWFNPVYKKHVKTEKVFVGSPSREVSINSKGGITVDKYSFTGKDLLAIEDLLTSESDNLSNELSLRVETVWVGCAQGLAISRGDIRQLYALHNKLNPKK